MLGTGMEWLVTPTTLPLGMVSHKVPTQRHTHGEGDPARRSEETQAADHQVPREKPDYRTTPPALGQAQLQCGTGKEW